MPPKKVVVVIAARNEEKYLPGLIDSLLNQSLPPSLIIVVDDGSVDATAEIVKSYDNQKVILIQRKERIGGPSLLGTPMIAIPFNLGFQYIENKGIEYDYIMVAGADNLYNEQYIEKMIQKFKEDPLLVVASGFQGEKINPDHARGGGRFIRKSFWKKYGAQYPFPSHLWESGIIFTAKMMGLKVRSFAEIVFKARRKSGSNIDMMHYGQILRAVNYPFLIVIGRAIKLFLKKGLKSAIRFLSGYLMSPVQRFEADKKIRKYIRKYLIIEKIRFYLKKLFNP
jgi:glycosyltransferase involved in cell wall biosynthesis